MAELNTEVIARTGLRLLGEVGLDGLTMRALAKELGVQAAALYWHVMNKQSLLAEMATIMFREAIEGLEAPGRDGDWAQWCRERARQLRRVILGHRDGARVFAGSYVVNSELSQAIEQSLHGLRDIGFDLRTALRGIPVLFHYTVGFTLEEQARLAGGDPRRTERPADQVDAERFPLTAMALPYRFGADTDAAFEDGLEVVIAGLRTTYFTR